MTQHGARILKLAYLVLAKSRSRIHYRSRDSFSDIPDPLSGVKKWPRLRMRASPARTRVSPRRVERVSHAAASAAASVNHTPEMALSLTLRGMGRKAEHIQPSTAS